MESHSVACHPRQVNVLRHNFSQAGCLVLNLPAPEGWKAELVVGYILNRFTCPQTVTYPSSNNLIAARLGVEPTIP